ncbi:pirin family protein [uncultured Fibrella sp.]|uniref:pirin family protein n=1 Tax=uncultured Fibrella sp. TaxID=1284596 RepID=UPI0035CA307D
MKQLIRKQDQQQVHLFGGNFHTNKPVVQGVRPALAPYSNLFYWSHAIATGNCEFGLHPHEGWEIMTFILAGQNTHYDTESRTWTALETGDFQVIQAGSGLEHAEKIVAGTRSFQIWFDPNFQQSLRQKPTYTDYHADQLKPVEENGLRVTYYVGGNGPAAAQTNGLIIRKLHMPARTKHRLSLNIANHHAFYVLHGSPELAGDLLAENDMLRVSGEAEISLATELDSDVFVIENPLQLLYKTAWQ